MDEELALLRNRLALLDVAVHATTWELWEHRDGKLVQTSEGKVVALFEEQADAVGMATIHNDLPGFLQLVQQLTMRYDESTVAARVLGQIKGLLEGVQPQPIPANQAVPTQPLEDLPGDVAEEPPPLRIIPATLGRQYRQRSAITEAFRRRFWERVQRTAEHPYEGHWYWTGQRDHTGMPFLQHNNVKIPAARVAYELEIHPLRKDQVLIPKCTDPLCISPYHYQPAQSTESRLREELTHLTGVELSQERVFELRNRYASGLVTDLGLVEETQLPLSAIHRLLDGITPKREVS